MCSFVEKMPLRECGKSVLIRKFKDRNWTYSTCQQIVLRRVFAVQFAMQDRPAKRMFGERKPTFKYRMMNLVFVDAKLETISFVLLTNGSNVFATFVVKQ